MRISLAPQFNRNLGVFGLVFVICMGAGVVAGLLIRANKHDGSAAASITVVNNDQVVVVDSSTQETAIKRTSEVNVKNPHANTGYLLTAKIGHMSIAGAKVTIGSDDMSALHCTLAAPCELDLGGAVLPILYPENNGDATTHGGDTSIWEITITVPPNTVIGNYSLEIDFGEEPVTPMQALAYEDCSEQRDIAYDARNGQVYYIQRIGELCWMETNLRYGGNGNYDSSWGWEDDRYATSVTNTTATAYDDTRDLQMTSSGYFGGSQDNAYTVAGVADAGGSLNYTTPGPGDSTTPAFYGYHYNWCAAMGGQPNACDKTTGVPQSNFDTTVSICPAGWRLPTGGGVRGTSPDDTDFGRLNNLINNGSTSDRQGLINEFLSVNAGYYSYLLGYHGAAGMYRSSTVNSGTSAYVLYLDSYDVEPGNESYVKSDGYAVRCVLPEIKPITELETMQEVTSKSCEKTTLGAIATLRDTRDDTYYRVKKMADNRCWMIDNLALDLTATYAGKPAWGTAPVKISGNTTLASDRPQLALNNNTVGQGQIPNGSGPAKPSYLYNWCAALADISVNCSASAAAAQYDTVTNGTLNTSGTATSQPEVTGICPAPFRLPKGGPTASLSNPVTTANEFAKLTISVGGTGGNGSDTDSYTLLTTPQAIDAEGKYWLGVHSGFFGIGLSFQGTYGLWWSSTANSGTEGYVLHLYALSTNVSPASIYEKNYGMAVRCIL